FVFMLAGWMGVPDHAPRFPPSRGTGQLFAGRKRHVRFGRRGSLALTPPRAVRYARLLTRSSVKPRA
ncbi:MAG TPA: hypothetical protein VF772_06765, partial [Terriglobales bacterium]